MTKIGIFPGSFDPLTVGHEDIIKRALPLFDNLIIAIGNNSNKKYLYSPQERKAQIERVFADEVKVRVEIYSGLTINFCKAQNAQFILRGIRTSGDFEFERNIGLMNLDMAPEIESIYIISRPEYSALSSSVVRDIQKHGGDISKYIPKQLL